MAKADKDSGGRQRHARLGGRLQRGRTRAGSKRWQRHGVVMMAAEAEDGSGGRRQRRTKTMATADDDSGGRRRRQTTTARKIGRQTTRGKEESGQQTTTALDKRLISPPGREREKTNKSSLHKNTFFSDRVCAVGFFVPPNQPMSPFRSISLK
jgi:hypothetical protein